MSATKMNNRIRYTMEWPCFIDISTSNSAASADTPEFEIPRSLYVHHSQTTNASPPHSRNLKRAHAHDDNDNDSEPNYITHNEDNNSTSLSSVSNLKHEGNECMRGRSLARTPSYDREYHYGRKNSFLPI